MSYDLVILVPTRARPHAVFALAKHFAATCHLKTWLVWCVDGDDEPERYNWAFRSAVQEYPWQLMQHGPRRRLVGTLNHYAAQLALSQNSPFAIGYLGDDHQPETPGWDNLLVEALLDLQVGLVYGDDGIQHANLPTAVAMTTSIVRALGYYAPPGLQHLYCDNFWKDLGEGADCLRYLPDVTIRHHHPSHSPNVAWDRSYQESNAASQYLADGTAYTVYREQQLTADIATVKNLRGSA